MFDFQNLLVLSLLSVGFLKFDLRHLTWLAAPVRLTMAAISGQGTPENGTSCCYQCL